jgi:fluoride exporter
MLKHILLVAIGGAVGSVARFLIQKYVHQMYPDPFPVGTFVVNLTGCLAIGLLYGITASHGILNTELRLLLMTGVLGGFTTFSAFSLESVGLLEQQRFMTFFLYIGGSVVLGLLATLAGAWLTR